LDIAVDDKVYILGHLYGPLWHEGESIHKGQAVARLASKKDNGGWRPHLHIQCLNRDFYKTYDNPRDLDAYAPKDSQLTKEHHDPFV